MLGAGRVGVEVGVRGMRSVWEEEVGTDYMDCRVKGGEDCSDFHGEDTDEY